MIALILGSAIESYGSGVIAGCGSFASVMYLSTLRSYVEAMGGTLEIRAVFPDGDVKIDLLNKLSA